MDPLAVVGQRRQALPRGRGCPRSSPEHVDRPQLTPGWAVLTMTAMLSAPDAAPALGRADFSGLLDRYLLLCRDRLGDALLAVALYGSGARGTARPWSDLDLLVVHQGDRRRAYGEMLGAVLALRDTPEYTALRRNGIHAEPYPLLLSRERLAATPWILLDVADHGLILYDPTSILARKLASVRKRLEELGSRRIVRLDGSWYWDLKPDLKAGEIFEL